MKTRIIEFLKAENKSSAQFADDIGVQPSSISHIISGRNNPSLDFVTKMLLKYPSLSTDWLLFGKGNMYREPQIRDLFDSSEESGLQKEKSAIRHDDIFADSIPDMHNESGIRDNQSEKSPTSGTKRIICFFSDDTFKEYFPSH